MRDYLLFKKMIAPSLLKILFWPALAASIYYSAWLIIAGNPIGWVPLIVGSLFVRVVFEMLLLFFSINENLSFIRKNMEERRNIER